MTREQINLLTTTQLDKLTELWNCSDASSMTAVDKNSRYLGGFSYKSEFALKRFDVYFLCNNTFLGVHVFSDVAVPRIAIRHALGYRFRHLQDSVQEYKTKVMFPDRMTIELVHRRTLLATCQVLNAIQPV